MQQSEEFDFFRLSNGMRLVHCRVDSAVAHAGVIIEAGCRDEEPAEHGIAHFIEHCLFKGTQKRTAFQIFSRLEDVGGELNAYTAREETFVYASFLPEFYSRALELFADIIYHSAFPEKELEKEKLVVLDEINSGKDNPYEMIYDQFEEMVFKGHPLGRNILGTEKTIRNFQARDLRNFISRLYRPEKMVICSVGNIPGKDLWKIAEQYFGHYAENHLVTHSTLKLFQKDRYTAFNKTIRKRTYQTHCVLGNLAYHYRDDKRLAFALLINLLGGPAMSSRLNMSIREKYGHAYQVESSYTPYLETGIFSIYLGTDSNNLEKSLELVKAELKKLCTQRIGPIQLHKAKKQYIGQTAISIEVNLNQLLSIGKSYLIYDRVDTLAEIVRKIEKLSSAALMEVANEIFNPEDLSFLIYHSK